MACFLVPVGEALVTTVAAAIIKKKEKKEAADISLPDGSVENTSKTGFSKKLGWLNKLLWGGSALLAFEHLWHGEIAPWFPFLTAMSDPGDAAEMFREMATVGVGMAALITLVWVGMVIVSSVIEKRALRASEKESADRGAES